MLHLKRGCFMHCSLYLFTKAWKDCNMSCFFQYSWWVCQWPIHTLRLGPLWSQCVTCLQLGGVFRPREQIFPHITVRPCIWHLDATKHLLPAADSLSDSSPTLHFTSRIQIWYSWPSGSQLDGEFPNPAGGKCYKLSSKASRNTGTGSRESCLQDISLDQPVRTGETKGR